MKTPIAVSIQDCALGGFVGIGLGLLLLLFRKPVARFIIASQNKTWGFHFDERVVVRSARVAIPLVAVSMIVLGLLGVFVSPCQR